ncbi:MAG TPA: hypothetical protein DEB42_08590, partial [Jeotgalicoccus sp.]|nr:hypothetical protein [Jeotgalicoccus sp.]
MKKTVVSVATLTAITGVAATAVSADEYTIASGDTLWGIANEVGTSVADLKADNELSSDIIFPGDVLTVNPEAAEEAPAPASNESSYIVKPGDTLWAIGAEFSLDYNEIMKWNNLSSDLIFVGQELSIDGSAVSAPAVEEAPAVETVEEPVVEEVQEVEPAAEVVEAPVVEEVQEVEPAEEVVEAPVVEEVQEVEPAIEVVEEPVVEEIQEVEPAEEVVEEPTAEEIAAQEAEELAATQAAEQAEADRLAAEEAAAQQAA